MEQQNKKIHLEVLRIICISLVIFNHTAPYGYLAFIGETNPFLYYIYMFFSILCKVAVPIFFMISGALLLGKQESIKVILKKRVFRMLIVLLAVSLLYYIGLTKIEDQSFFGFFSTVYTSTATTSLWYLYAYIGFLLMLPFLRAIVVSIKEKDYAYLFIIHAFFTIVFTVLDKFLFIDGHNGFMSHVFFLESSIFYPLMGYYIENVMDVNRFKKNNYCLFCGLSLFSIIATCAISKIYFNVYQHNFDNYIYESCFNVLIFIPAISIFFVFKGIVKINSNSTLGRVICQLGRAVFGVYLIEKLCRLVVSPIIEIIKPIVGRFFSSIVMVFAVMIMGFSMVLILKNIPFLKKIVNLFI